MKSSHSAALLFVAVLGFLVSIPQASFAQLHVTIKGSDVACYWGINPLPSDPEMRKVAEQIRRKEGEICERRPSKCDPSVYEYGKCRQGWCVFDELQRCPKKSKEVSKLAMPPAAPMTMPSRPLETAPPLPARPGTAEIGTELDRVFGYRAPMQGSIPSGSPIGGGLGSVGGGGTPFAGAFPSFFNLFSGLFGGSGDTGYQPSSSYSFNSVPIQVSPVYYMRPQPSGGLFDGDEEGEEYNDDYRESIFSPSTFSNFQLPDYSLFGREPAFVGLGYALNEADSASTRLEGGSLPSDLGDAFYEPTAATDASGGRIAEAPPRAPRGIELAEMPSEPQREVSRGSSSRQLDRPASEKARRISNAVSNFTSRIFDTLPPPLDNIPTLADIVIPTSISIAAAQSAERTIDAILGGYSDTGEVLRAPQEVLPTDTADRALDPPGPTIAERIANGFARMWRWFLAWLMIE